MELIFTVFFWISLFIIFWAMIGYPISLKILDSILKKEDLVKDYNYEPTVTIMVVAHNEEKIIKNKLNNIINIDYPKNKIEFLIASDNSTDSTNQIVENFIKSNKQYRIRLHKAKKRMGKTNAQNEAQKIVTSEILVMTDANSMLQKDSVKELVSTFTKPNISYVCGQLVYSNSETNSVANSENSYWNIDLQMRKIESDIQTITAGNGAIYACKNSEYVAFDSIHSHDSYMPRYYALQRKRAVFNPQAIAYEKAGEVTGDEFRRKVRMNREILTSILPSIKMLNIFRYKWYPYFYFGHRSCRYLLWISHFILLLSNLILAFYNPLYLIVLIIHFSFYLLALLNKINKCDNKLTRIIYYYTMTILAQWVGVFNILSGSAKPFWEKAESTR